MRLRFGIWRRDSSIRSLGGAFRRLVPEFVHDTIPQTSATLGQHDKPHRCGRPLKDRHQVQEWFAAGAPRRHFTF